MSKSKTTTTTRTRRLWVTRDTDLPYRHIWDKRPMFDDACGGWLGEGLVCTDNGARIVKLPELEPGGGPVEIRVTVEVKR